MPCSILKVTSGSTPEIADYVLEQLEASTLSPEDLLAMISDPQYSLADKVKSLRRRFASDYGFLLPPIRINDNLYVSPEQYSISVQDIEVATGVGRNWYECKG